MNPDDDVAADPAWTGAARFLEGRVPPGLRVVAPGSFAPVLGALAEPDPAALPDWAVVATGAPNALPHALLRRLLAETTPVYANEGYVVFARRPTFGLADMRNAAPVRALADGTAADLAPSLSPPPGPSFLNASLPRATEPPEAAMAPLVPPRAPGIPRATLPPEALALQVPLSAQRAGPAMPPATPPLPRPTVPPLPAAAPPNVSPALEIPPPAPPASAPDLRRPAPAPASGTGWGNLPARVTSLLGTGAGLRVVALGAAGAAGLATGSLASSALVSEAADDLPASAFDAALILPASTSIAAELAMATRLLRPGGLALLIAENADSLGRRLTAALGRPAATPGLTATAIRGALHATGLIPLRLEGHSLDAWRATSESPPTGLAPADPAAALLEEVGEAAGPRHAAWLLFLARKP
ncbi:MAG TPA: hypothetical protein VIL69_13090 [Roseomonas sp.]